MLRINVNKARVGMVLAQPVMHPRHPGHVLLRPGAELQREALRRLQELKVGAVWIEYPATSFLMRMVSPRVTESHFALVGEISRALDAAQTGVHANLEYNEYAQAVKRLVTNLVEDRRAAVFLHAVLDGDRIACSHAANVCFLALLMGIKLDGYLISERDRTDAVRAQNIDGLGIGALLHDIGHAALGSSGQEWEPGAHNEPSTAWREHVQTGYEIVKGKVCPTASAVVLHHHQRLDGTGFPYKTAADGAEQPLCGSGIHVFARIAAVADVFDTARLDYALSRSEEHHADDVPGCVGLKHVVSLARKGKLDPTAVKAIMSVVPAFAPGTSVSLSDGTTCIVTGWDPANPCKPEVRPVIGASLDEFEDLKLDKPIDLREADNLHITHADGVDVEQWNFQPRHTAEFDLRVPTPQLGTDCPAPQDLPGGTGTKAA